MAIVRTHLLSAERGLRPERIGRRSCAERRRRRLRLAEACGTDTHAIEGGAWRSLWVGMAMRRPRSSRQATATGGSRA
eukprot:365942-Chlamydomonas_euryale.AAC.6